MKEKPDIVAGHVGIQPDAERFCIHNGVFCPYSATCVYNVDTEDSRMQVCEAAIQTGIMKCAACQSRAKCKETWTCFRWQRWNRKRASREGRP